jgi:hypothetical protein
MSRQQARELAALLLRAANGEICADCGEAETDLRIEAFGPHSTVCARCGSSSRVTCDAP